MVRFDLGGAIELIDRARALMPLQTPDVAFELGLGCSLLLCGRPADAVARAAAASDAAARADDRLGAHVAELGRLAFETQIAGGNKVDELRRRLEEVLPEAEAAA